MVGRVRRVVCFDCQLTDFMVSPSRNARRLLNGRCAGLTFPFTSATNHRVISSTFEARNRGIIVVERLAATIDQIDDFSTPCRDIRDRKI